MENVNIKAIKKGEVKKKMIDNHGGNGKAAERVDFPKSGIGFHIY